MAKVEFLGPIGKDDIEVEIENLHDLKKILSRDKNLSQWLKNCSVAVNDKIVSNLDTKIEKNDKISLLPPVCGG